MTETPSQATPGTPEHDKSKTGPAVGKPMDQPAKTEPQVAPQKTS